MYIKALYWSSNLTRLYCGGVTLPPQIVENTQTQKYYGQKSIAIVQNATYILIILTLYSPPQTKHPGGISVLVQNKKIREKERKV